MRHELHVIHPDEVGSHIASAECTCSPKVFTGDIGTIIVHQNLDHPRETLTPSVSEKSRKMLVYTKRSC
jgi:hypothetical protein